MLHRLAWEHLGHRQQQEWHRQEQTDPEPAGHVDQFGIRFLFQTHGLWFEGHATDGAAARFRADNLRGAWGRCTSCPAVGAPPVAYRGLASIYCAGSARNFSRQWGLQKAYDTAIVDLCARCLVRVYCHAAHWVLHSEALLCIDVRYFAELSLVHGIRRSPHGCTHAAQTLHAAPRLRAAPAWRRHWINARAGCDVRDARWQPWASGH